MFLTLINAFGPMVKDLAPGAQIVLIAGMVLIVCLAILFPKNIRELLDAWFSRKK
jgi:hypothetical protein